MGSVRGLVQNALALALVLALEVSLICKVVKTAKIMQNKTTGV